MLAVNRLCTCSQPQAFNRALALISCLHCQGLNCLLCILDENDRSEKEHLYSKGCEAGMKLLCYSHVTNMCFTDYEQRVGGDLYEPEKV